MSKLKGELKRWNDDKGFGFIGAYDGGPDVFIHISALRKMARRPRVGDVINFEVQLDNNGKKRAVNASIEGVASVQENHKRPRTNTAVKRGGFLGTVIALVLVLGVGGTVYNALSSNPLGGANTSRSLPFASQASAANGAFSCTGKAHCSEMASCDEARFYLNNCPGTKMDGDGDGVPCEQQLCGW